MTENMTLNKEPQEQWNQPLTVGGLTALPGERVHGFLEIGEGEFSMPAAIIRGEKPGKTMLITSAVHAGEYVGVQSALELANELKIEKVVGNIVIVKAICRSAFENRLGSITREDDQNLNRAFPGDKNGTVTQRLAHAIEQDLLSIADYQIDLHSGDDYEELTPYVYYVGKAQPQVVETAKRMAQQVDVPYMVRSTFDTGGCYNYGGKLGIPGILLERGSMGQWTREEVDSMKRDVRNVLISLDIYEDQRDYREYYPLDMTDIIYQSASEFGFWHPEKKPGDLFHKNDLLGMVTDYEGKTTEYVRAEFDGVILFQTGSLQVVKEGPMIAYGKFKPEEKDERKKIITNYWTKRSDAFMEQKRRELHDDIAGRWLAEIQKGIPENRKLKILDVGCGAGFFSILMAKQGHEVIGVDLTPDMVDHAKILAKDEGVNCEFQVMDAEKLKFADETFDLVLSRNVIWTLPNAGAAYKEWLRVLKKDGTLVNFDANYGAFNDAEGAKLPKNHAHHTIGDDMMQENEKIKGMLSISGYARPSWDLQTLGDLGVERFTIDKGVGRRIFLKQDEFYNPAPIFLLSASKC